MTILSSYLTAISKSRNWKLNFVTFLMAKPMTLNCVRLLDQFILLSVNVFSFHFWNINMLDNSVLIIFCKPEKLRILKPVHVHEIQKRACGPVKGFTPVVGSRGGEGFRNLGWGRQEVRAWLWADCLDPSPGPAAYYVAVESWEDHLPSVL